MGCMYMLTRIQCEAPKISKLVQITPVTMVYGTQLTIVFLGLLLTNVHITTGGLTLYMYMFTRI